MPKHEDEDEDNRTRPHCDARSRETGDLQTTRRDPALGGPAPGRAAPARSNDDRPQTRWPL